MFLPPKTWTPSDVAALLGTTRGNVHLWIADGRLPAVQDESTGRWSIELTSLQAFLRARPGSRPQPTPAGIDWSAQPRRLSVAQAAKVLGLSSTYLGTHVRTGALPARRLAGRWRIAMEDLRRFAEQRHARAEGRPA